MKKMKKFRLIGVLLILILAVTACGKMKSESKNSYDMDYATDESGSYNGETTAAPAAMPEEEMEKPKADGSYGGGVENSSTFTSQELVNQTQDKIIRRFYLDVETQEFDSLITQIDSEIGRLGGYVENSKISGKRYNYTGDARYGSIIVRVPADKLDEFVNSVDENSNVINKQESTENVTLAYTDIESRKKTLEIEQDRIFVLLEKTVSLESMITLESRLSEIRYELQSYETQLRTYDNQVEYSTVTLSIQEVERMTPVVEEKQTVGNRIKNGFSDTAYDISEGFKNFFVWFVVNLPYLLIWAIIITAIVLITKRYIKKMNKKNNFTPAILQNQPTPGRYYPTQGQNSSSQAQDPSNQGQNPSTPDQTPPTK